LNQSGNAPETNGDDRSDRRGNLDVRAEDLPADIIGELATSFNRMTETSPARRPT